MNRVWRYLRDGWERLLFGCVGAACLVFTFAFLWHSQVPAASAVFAMAVFSFFYSNLARFKRFKGLGFEAELWEDKQKEAADLIERLKRVVTVYTREIVMNNVMRGRIGGAGWKKSWELLDELESRHLELGQEIDFSDLKMDVENTFISDLCYPSALSVTQSIEAAKSKALRDAGAQFGSPIKDIDGYRRLNENLQSIVSEDDALFVDFGAKNVASSILEIARNAQAKLLDDFGVELNFKAGVIERLEAVAALIDNRPIKVTDELINWADDQLIFVS